MSFKNSNNIVSHEENLPKNWEARIQFEKVTGGTFTALLRGDTVTLGRHPSNEIVISDASIAPFHVEFYRPRSRATYEVRDLGSYRGTRVNNVEISESTLADGDVIGLGLWTGNYECALSQLAKREILNQTAELERCEKQTENLKSEGEHVQEELTILHRDLSDLTLQRDKLQKENELLHKARDEVLVAIKEENDRREQTESEYHADVEALRELVLEKERVVSEIAAHNLAHKDRQSEMQREVDAAQGDVHQIQLDLKSLRARSLEMFAEQEKHNQLRVKFQKLEQRYVACLDEIAECKEIEKDLASMRDTRLALDEIVGAEAQMLSLFVSDLIGKLDLLDILIEHCDERHDARWVKEQLYDLRSSFRDLLAAYGFTAYAIAAGTILDMEVRRRIRIVETKNSHEKTSCVLETHSVGFTCTASDGTSIILRKAEVSISTPPQS